jgi:hypothetical protein
MEIVFLGGYALLVLYTAFSAKSRGNEAFYVNNRACDASGMGFPPTRTSVLTVSRRSFVLFLGVVLKYSLLTFFA